MALTASLVLALGLLVSCSDDGDGQAADSTATVTEVSIDRPDEDQFCARLADALADDPFDGIFGQDNPMEAAAAFDGGQSVLDALVDVAPDDVVSAAANYRDALAGFRGLILPATTIDASSYEAEFEALSAERDAARESLEAHLATDCPGGGDEG